MKCCDRTFSRRGAESAVDHSRDVLFGCRAHHAINFIAAVEHDQSWDSPYAEPHPRLVVVVDVQLDHLGFTLILLGDFLHRGRKRLARVEKVAEEYQGK